MFCMDKATNGLFSSVKSVNEKVYISSSSFDVFVNCETWVKDASGTSAFEGSTSNEAIPTSKDIVESFGTVNCNIIFFNKLVLK